MQHPKSLDLHRLKKGDGDPLTTKVAHDAAFVSTGRLDTDVLDTGGLNCRGELLPAVSRIQHVHHGGLAVDRHVERTLRGIDPRRKCIILRHLH